MLLHLLPGSTYIISAKYRIPQSFKVKDEKKLFEILQTRELTAKNLQSLFSRSRTRYGK